MGAYHRDVVGFTFLVGSDHEVRALYIRYEREASPFFEFLATRLFKGCFVDEFLL